MPSGIEHFVITRFSYRRLAPSEGPRGTDPLRPPALERRLTLLRVTALPSLCRQTTGRFTWVIVVDPSLPLAYQERLLKLTAAGPPTVLHPIQPGDDLTTTEWLNPYRRQPDAPLLTTLLDDDDALAVDYLQRVQSWAQDQAAQLPPGALAAAGTASALEWDLAVTQQAPFGYLKPWRHASGEERFPVSAGMSVLTTRAELALSTFAIPHRWGPQILEPQAPPQESLRRVREPLRRKVTESGRKWSQWLAASRFDWMEASHPLAVMTNHGTNDQWQRLIQRHEHRQLIEGSNSFGLIPVDLEVVTDAAELFQLNERARRTLVARAFLTVWASTGSGYPRRWWKAVRAGHRAWRATRPPKP